MIAAFRKTFLIGIIALGAAGQANAAALLFNDFSDLTGLQLNGATGSIHSCAASGDGSTCSGIADTHGHDVLRLTDDLSQSGSAFSTTSIPLNADVSFSTSFKFHFTDQQNTGADGIVFTVQTVSNTAGGEGGGIGYEGLDNSVGVEFDNWNNGGQDDGSANHVGINLDGSVNSEVLSTSIPTLDDGDTFTAWVDYDGENSLLEVRANTTGARPASPLLSHSVDLVNVLESNDAFVGFTSGTGSAGADHDILSWQFNSSFDPIDDIGDGGSTPVPEPGTLGLFGLALAGVGFFRLRKTA